MTASFTNARSANGPRLVAWIEVQVGPVHERSAYQRRRMTRWRSVPHHPSYYDADALLCALGLHPSDVPESVWRLAAPTTVEQLTCVQCGGPLSDAQRNDGNLCCSQGCAATFRGIRKRNPPEYKPCRHCGRMFQKPLGQSRANWSKRQFCDEQCRNLGTVNRTPWREQRAVSA